MNIHSPKRKLRDLKKLLVLNTPGHSSGMLTGSLTAGLMMDMFQLRHAFSFGSLIMILGTGLFFFIRITGRKKLLKTE